MPDGSSSIVHRQGLSWCRVGPTERACCHAHGYTCQVHTHLMAYLLAGCILLRCSCDSSLRPGLRSKPTTANLAIGPREDLPPLAPRPCFTGALHKHYVATGPVTVPT